MVWTNDKPTLSGYYWLRMVHKEPGKPWYSEQHPRLVLVETFEDIPEDGLWAKEAPEYDDGFRLEEMSDCFEWSSSPVSLPVEAGSCGGKGEEACYACQ